MNDWKIRKALPDDLSFIYATWSKSYRYDSAIGKSCRNSVFFPHYYRVMDWILLQPNTKTLVACHPEEASVIFGYLIYEPNVLHYAYTKEAFFKFGIAKSLFEKTGGIQFYTHKTKMAHPILIKHQELTYNPFLLFHQGENHGEIERNSEVEQSIG